MKFKQDQEVIVLGMLHNGDRMDIMGRIEGQGKGSNRSKIAVRVNGVTLHFEEARLIDATEYWTKKRAEKKES